VLSLWITTENLYLRPNKSLKIKTTLEDKKYQWNIAFSLVDMREQIYKSIQNYDNTIKVRKYVRILGTLTPTAWIPNHWDVSRYGD
jgi:hypothetical protein